jgi:enoyl-CoA hydratase
LGEFVLTRVESPVGWITINRPEVRNALDNPTWAGLQKAFADMEADPDVKAVIVTGAGDKAFVAGGDLRMMRQRTVQDTSYGMTSGVLRCLEKMKKPVIAAVNGYALGGGCELAIACDIRIASERAKFGQTELNVGVIPGAGGTQRLARLIGLGRAMDMVLTAKIIDAAEAERIGLVSRVVPADQLLESARDLALQLSKKSPGTLRFAKQLVNSSLDWNLDTGLLIEVLAQAATFGTEDHNEGIDAFFEKRDPNYKGK